MLISYENKFLFVHIQKTAGRSMALLLKEHIPDLTHYMGTHDHALWAMNQGDLAWSDYYKVAFVRNPWDRLVSWYMMITQRSAELKQQGGDGKGFRNHLWQYVMDHSSSFEEFLYNCTDSIEDADGKKSFLFNQVDYITDEHGEVIVDFIGRFESLERDTKIIFERLGLSSVVMPHYNSSERTHYRDYYNDDTRRLVEDRYSRDIEYFHYEF